MTPILEHGEAVVSIVGAGGRDYLLRPSFEAMMRLGTPEEIVDLYAAVHSGDVIELMERAQTLPATAKALSVSALSLAHDRLLGAAVRIIEACCDDDLTPVVGEWVGGEDRVSYVPGQLEPHDLLIMAQHFIQHGVTGKAKTRQLQRHESNETSRGFNAHEYINAARIHLDMTREEAMRLTMTEFQMLLAAKYPDQKGFTREEYDDVADDFLIRQMARREAMAARGEL